MKGSGLELVDLLKIMFLTNLKMCIKESDEQRQAGRVEQSSRQQVDSAKAANAEAEKAAADAKEAGRVGF